MNNYPKLDADILAHHGILGQKWGKRNGPPYPLSAGKHSFSEKKAGWKKSLGGGRNEELYDRVDKQSASVQNKSKSRMQLTSGQKKAIAIGAGVAVTAAIVGVGIYTGQFDKLAAGGKKIGTRILASNGAKKLSGLVMGGSEPTSKAAQHFGTIAKIGSTWNDSLNAIKERASKENCGASSAAMVIRENDRVNLLPKTTKPMNWKEMESLWNGVREHAKVMPLDNAQELADYLSKKFKDGDNGILGMNSKDTSKYRNHFMTFSKEKGKIIFRDGKEGFQFVLENGLMTISNGVEVKQVPSSVADRLFDRFDFWNTEYMQTNGLRLTDDMDLLDKWFESG